MKGKIISFLVIVLAVLFVFTACSPQEERETANVNFSLIPDRARTIKPDDTDIVVTEYVFTLTGTKTYSKSFEYDKGGVYTLIGIQPGNYTVKVQGKNAKGQVIAENSSTHFFVRGDNSLKISLNTLYGTGTVDLSVIWNKNSYNKVPTLSLSVINEKGESVTIPESAINLSGEANGNVQIKHSLPSGSYIFIFTLKDGEQILIGYTEVVRVSNGVTTGGTIDFTKGGDVNNKVGILDNTTKPIEATLTLTKTANNQVKCDLNFTYLPEGISESDVTITWYNEDFECDAGNNKKSYTFLSLPGTSRITAVFKSTKTGSMGAVSDYYTNE